MLEKLVCCNASINYTGLPDFLQLTEIFFRQTSVYTAIDDRSQYIARSAAEHCFHLNAKVRVV